jgi:two-component sensor histidine kinase
MKPGIRRQWAIAFVLWSIPALLFTIPALREGRTASQIILTESLPWLIWALLTPFVLAQARRYPLEQPHRARDIRVHLGTALLIGVLYGTVNIVLYFLFGEPPPGRVFLRSWLEGVLVWLPLSVIFYAALASVGFVLAYQQRLQEGRVHAAQLEAQLSDARLQALRHQLNPHFLFNTLNTIAMHVRSGDTQTSVRMLARLSELLRHMLEEARAQEVPLRTEMEYVERYLEIEGARFSDRLSTRVDVPETVRDALVPNLLLQPLVENAVRHGIARRADAGRLELRAQRVNDRLILEVLNDGVALPAGFDCTRAQGIGLRNTVSRLAHLYGDAASIRLENRPGAVVAAIVELPWRT